MKNKCTCHRAIPVLQCSWYHNSPSAYIYTSVVVNRALPGTLQAVCTVCDDFVISGAPTAVSVTLVMHAVPSYGY